MVQNPYGQVNAFFFKGALTALLQHRVGVMLSIAFSQDLFGWKTKCI